MVGVEAKSEGAADNSGKADASLKTLVQGLNSAIHGAADLEFPAGAEYHFLKYNTASCASRSPSSAMPPARPSP